MYRLNLILVAVVIGALPAHADPPKPQPPGEKVVAFAEKNLGKQVGDGQCAALANHALRAAGCKGRGPDEPAKGDYTWGKLVFTLEATPAGLKPTGKVAEIRAGDVIQLRDTKWVSRTGRRTYTRTMPHHTVVVRKVDARTATLAILHQNFGGKKVVMEAALPLNELAAGWIRVYRPVLVGTK